MNIRKNVDYNEMYCALDNLMNQQLTQTELYCAIGKAVCQRPEKGAAVMAAEYLHKHYPDVPGFSPRNVRRMRDFYRTYEHHPKLLKLAMQIGWIQNVVIMEADLIMELREWYMRAAKQFGWSKTELIANITAKAHENITLDIDEKVCYNEEETENGETTVFMFSFHIIQRTHLFDRYWNHHRKKHRRRWHTMMPDSRCTNNCKPIQLWKGIYMTVERLREKLLYNKTTDGYCHVETCERKLADFS